MIRNEGNKLTRVVVCSPKHEYFHVDNHKAHNITQEADRLLAIRQHDILKALINGIVICNLPEDYRLKQILLQVNSDIHF